MYCDDFQLPGYFYPQNIAIQMTNANLSAFSQNTAMGDRAMIGKRREVIIHLEFFAINSDKITRSMASPRLFTQHGHLPLDHFAFIIV